MVCVRGVFDTEKPGALDQAAGYGLLSQHQNTDVRRNELY